ncbi:MAG TPA: sulfotransferase [Vicinamibacterales bacterium]|jgi:hypothetical protein|nr:sulfotransferase [Vicinamibacterales bacterium]
MRFALVTGCPRSGTTPMVGWLGTSPHVLALCESRRTLAVHRYVEEAKRFKSTFEEWPLLRERLRAFTFDLYAGGTRLVVDKEPLEPVAFPAGDYAAYLSNMVHVLDARFVFMVRDPVVTIGEMIVRLWGYSLTAGEPVGMTIERAISIWKDATKLALERVGRTSRLQSYERLVADPRRESIAICKFLEVVLPEAAFPVQTIQPKRLPEQAVELIRAETAELWNEVQAITES